ncbi:transglutaminase [Flammeovirgaceae bacterium 311]|nr:transglutaminase [Flammeovirgaceae bacterium 311]
MITYQVIYEAENHYEHEVTEALFKFLVLPCSNDTQEVLEETVENSLDLPVFHARNVFGYQVISIRVAEPFQHFRLKVSCTVRKKTTGVLHITEESLPLEEELRILQSEDFIVDHFLYIQQTPLTELPVDRIPAELLFQKDKSLFDYITELNDRLHNMMEYEAGVTTFSTRACDVLENPKGVCQDYTHLMMGILRQQQIPCRYVSGYLNQGQVFIGSLQMHAWLEVYIPSMGWVGIDPTNNMMSDQHYIKVADGADFDDCSPLKGHIRPTGPNTTNHTVEVSEQTQQQQQQQQ